MTYREIVQKLKSAGIENATWDTFLLIEHFCHLSADEIMREPEQQFSSPELLEAVERRAARVPLQYLLEQWQFYKQTYKVSPDCLIPRSDTEILVEEAIKRLPKGAFFADLCTGSGCIAISILCERKDTTAIAVDLSDAALQIATENAVRNGVSDRIFFRKANLLESSANGWNAHIPAPAAILSNPPYIRTSELANLSPEVQAEPRMALDGGEDGLVFYRKLLALSQEWLAPKGFCLFEIGYDQAADVRELTKKQFTVCKIIKDLSQNDRVVFLKKPI